ncbi:MAG TPA: hypothetical protein VF268_04265 [Gammaproteobacteria bacterium]
MKATINKEQHTEISRWLEKQRVPKETIDLLLNSRNAANTAKAYRMKKQIITPDGWAIHFGANWARLLEKPGESAEADTLNPSDSQAATIADDFDNKKDIKKLGEDFLSRTFMGLAEKLKKLQVEDVDKPQMQKIAVEIDKDHLAMLKKYAAENKVTVGSLIRRGVRELLEKL